MLEWDYEDRLVKVTKPDGPVIENVYDVDGVLLWTSVTPAGGSAQVTDLLVDTNGGLSHVVAEIDGSGTVTALYVRAGDMLLEEIDKLRAVLDTSVLVAGIVWPAGTSGRVLRAFRDGRCTHITSSAILDEMVDVLSRAKIQRTTPLSHDEIADLRFAMEERTEAASGEYQDVDLVKSDPKDNPVVAAPAQK